MPGQKISQALGSFSWLVLDRIVVLGSSAIVGFAIARHLGPHDFGLLSYVVAIAAFATAIGNLGVGPLLTRDLAYERESEGRILGSASIATTAAMTLVTLAITIWTWIFPPADPRLHWLISLVVAAGILQRFEFLESWFLVHSRVRSYAVARMATTLLFVVVRIILLGIEAPLQVFIAVQAAETAAIGIRCLLSYRAAAGVRPRWQWDKSTAVSLLRRSWPVAVGSIALFAHVRLNVMLLTWWRSPEEAGLYSAASRLSEVWYFVPVLLTSAVFPALLELRKTDRPLYMRRLQTLLDILAGAGTIVAIAVTFLAHWIVPLLYGDQYRGAASILVIHVWAAVFVFMRAVVSKWLVAEEQYLVSLITNGAAAVFSLGASVLLIPVFGGLGAACSLLLSQALGSFFMLCLLKRTREIFRMQARALCWPLRAPAALDLIRTVISR